MLPRSKRLMPPPLPMYQCYSHTHDEVLKDYQLPEMLRVGLEDLSLQVLTLDLGEPSVFLSKALDPPSALAMSNSLKLLQSLGAVECQWQGNGLSVVDSEEDIGDCSKLSVKTELTALGFHLASLPVEPRVGKMMVYGAIFGCTDPALSIAAAITSSKPLFVSPFDQRDAAREARVSLATEESDLLTMLNAFDKWRNLRKTKGARAAQKFAREKFMSQMTLYNMQELRRHYASLLVDIGFLPSGYRVPKNVAEDERPSGANANSGNVALLKAVLCAGLYPNVIVAPKSLSDGTSTKQACETSFQSHKKGDVFLHPCTISFAEKRLESRYCCFHEIVKTSKMYVRDCTPVSPVALLLFGGATKVYHGEGVITVDDWLQFRISAKSAVLISHLRLQMEKVLLQKILSPELDVAESRAGKELIDVVTIILANEKPAGEEAIRGEAAIGYGRGGVQSTKKGRGSTQRVGGGRGSGGRPERNAGRGRGPSR